MDVEKGFLEGWDWRGWGPLDESLGLFGEVAKIGLTRFCAEKGFELLMVGCWR